MPRTIRAARPADTDPLYDICLRTGRSGEDASADHALPRILGDVYVGPYLRYAPDLAFVLVDDADAPIGYVLGVAETRTFDDALAREWWPEMRARYPLAASDGLRPRDRAMVDLIHAGPRTTPDVTRDHPAHLHVDLLPEGQGGGDGRRLLETLFGALRTQGVRGVHLGVSSANPRAVGFYRHLGFTTLTSDPDGMQLGLRLL